MTLALIPEIGIEIPDNITYTDLCTRAEAACETIKVLEDQGLLISPSDQDNDVASTLLTSYAKDVEKTSKAVTNERMAGMTPASLVQTDAILKEFGQLVAKQASEVRNMVVNKLILETENKKPNFAKKAGKATTKGTNQGKTKTLEQSVQPKKPSTKTIVGDLLDIDRDLYIVQGELGEIQIEATYKTDVTEEFKFGDRIKALVLMNNRALKIERAGPNDVPGVVENQAVASEALVAKEEKKSETKGATQGKTKALEQSVQPKKPSPKTIIGDIIDIDRDL